jgi:hypothetical protein
VIRHGNTVVGASADASIFNRFSGKSFTPPHFCKILPEGLTPRFHSVHQLCGQRVDGGASSDTIRPLPVPSIDNRS